MANRTARNPSNRPDLADFQRALNKRGNEQQESTLQLDNSNNLFVTKKRGKYALAAVTFFADIGTAFGAKNLGVRLCLPNANMEKEAAQLFWNLIEDAGGQGGTANDSQNLKLTAQTIKYTIKQLSETNTDFANYIHNQFRTSFKINQDFTKNPRAAKYLNRLGVNIHEISDTRHRQIFCDIYNNIVDEIIREHNISDEQTLLKELKKSDQLFLNLVNEPLLSEKIDRLNVSVLYHMTQMLEAFVTHNFDDYSTQEIYLLEKIKMFHRETGGSNIYFPYIAMKKAATSLASCNIKSPEMLASFLYSRGHPEYYNVSLTASKKTGRFLNSVNAAQDRHSPTIKDMKLLQGISLKAFSSLYANKIKSDHHSLSRGQQRYLKIKLNQKK